MADTTRSMATSIATPTSVKEPAWLGLALWRLSAGILYALALLLVPRHLLTAVFLLLTALLCLQSFRAAFHRHTGVRVGRMFSQSGATALVLGAVLGGGGQVKQPISEVRVPGELVIAAVQAATP